MPSGATPSPATRCPLCGGPNACAPALAGSLDVACWCSQVTIDPVALDRIPEAQRGKACLCRSCAARHGGFAERAEGR